MKTSVCRHTLFWVGVKGGGSIFEKFQGGALFLSFIAFVCDNFKKILRGGHQSPGGSVPPHPHENNVC